MLMWLGIGRDRGRGDCRALDFRGIHHRRAKPPPRGIGKGSCCLDVVDGDQPRIHGDLVVVEGVEFISGQP